MCSINSCRGRPSYMCTDEIKFILVVFTHSGIAEQNQSKSGVTLPKFNIAPETIPFQ